MKTKRNVYLKKKTLKAAKGILTSAFDVTEFSKTEILPACDAVGRVLAEPVTAELSSPNFHSAAMDGIAVQAEATFSAHNQNPLTLTIGKDAHYVNTGHVLPRGADAVIMIEDVNVLDSEQVQIEAPAFPWQHVRKMGEDIVATELLFSRNHLIRPACVGALLSGGIFSVCVRKKPHLLIISTGSELVEWQNTALGDLKPGRIIESNSYVLGEMAMACGGSYVHHGLVRDDLKALTGAVASAIQKDFDIVLMVGGSSAGSEDYSRQVIADLGEVLVHGVTMMPGKPVIIGKVGGKPVFGMPGYPVSAIMAFEQFVAPLIYGYLGRYQENRALVSVEPTRKIASKLGVEEFLRVKLGRVGNRLVATLLPRGAGCITSITHADGIIRVPENVEGLAEHTPVSAELLRPLGAIEQNIVVVGSHDNTLDILADQLRARHGRITLSSSHVGSLGGLMALKKGVCHLAGAHLLDMEDGAYNISYIKKYLPDLSVRVVNLVFRDQGLMLRPQNPKGIKGIEDLTRKDITFINRQGGSGTRILLDFRLKALGLDADDICGYDNEEFTHMSVAVAVLNGAADAGLGIYAAAKALKLDFIPVVTEQYDLIIPEVYFETDNIRTLLSVVKSAAFQKQVNALGGYATHKTGEIVYLHAPA